MVQLFASSQARVPAAQSPAVQLPCALTPEAAPMPMPVVRLAPKDQISQRPQ